ncbi:MAG: transporter [bacterium]
MAVIKNMKKKILLLFLVPVLLVGTNAGPLQAAEDERAALQKYPSRETQRPITMGKHLYETNLSISSLSTDRAWNEDGEVVETYGPYNLFTAELMIRYGLSESWQVSATLPYITGEIGETTGGSIGDIRAGLEYELFFGPRNSMSFAAEASYPSGLSDYHYEILGEDLRAKNFRTGDPGYNVYPSMAYRYRSESFSFRLRATGVFTGPGEIRFNQIRGFEKNVDMDPGDGYRAKVGFYYQFHDKWAGGLFGRYVTISASEVDGESLEDDNELFEARPFLAYQPNQKLDVSLGVGVPVYGRNNPLGYPVLLEVRSRF